MKNPIAPCIFEKAQPVFKKLGGKQLLIAVE